MKWMRYLMGSQPWTVTVHSHASYVYSFDPSPYASEPWPPSFVSNRERGGSGRSLFNLEKCFNSIYI